MTTKQTDQHAEYIVLAFDEDQYSRRELRRYPDRYQMAYMRQTRAGDWYARDSIVITRANDPTFAGVQETLRRKTVPVLKNLARKYGVTGYSDMRKNELVECIMARMNNISD